MLSPVTIRDAVPGDALELARVHVRCWQETYRGLVPDDEIDRRTVAVRVGHFETWLARASSRTLVAAGPGGAITGFVTGGPSDVEPGFASIMNGLYVVAADHRRGTGSALLHGFAAAMREGGFPSIVLWVLARNERARAFYEARGAEFVRADPAAPWDQVVYGWRDLAGLT